MPDQRPTRLIRKLEALGITGRDWERIRDLVARVTDRGSPPAILDLEAKFAVAAMPEDPRYQASQKLCVMVRPDGMRVKVIYWPLSQHELHLQGRD